MRYVHITIPVKTPVRKYVEAKYEMPMKLTQKHTIGHILFSLLDKESSQYREHPDILHKRYIRLTDSITMLIPSTAKHIYGKRFTPSETKSLLINSFFEKRLREELFSFCDIYAHVKLPQRQAIEEFCNQYGLQLGVDLKFDALRQAEFRHRKSFKKSVAEMSRA